MGRLYFYYGTMNSAKTANLLMKVYNYEHDFKKVVCLKPAIDTRNKANKIESRALSYSHACVDFDNNYDFKELMRKQYQAIFIDEAQFLTKQQVFDLAYLTENCCIDVFCYGLKNTYKKGCLFEGSEALFYYADEIQEIKSVCKYCYNFAKMNLLLRNGKPVYEGNPIVIGDIKENEEMYEQVCFYHYVKGGEKANETN